MIEIFRILYVDDEPELLELVKLFLEPGGEFTVEISSSATDAVSLMNTRTFDAVISDYQMPVMDGIEFLKRIRAAGNTIPFILFTGKGREEIVIQALNEGADFYLQKGGELKSQFAELSHTIRQAIQKRQTEHALRSSEDRLSTIFNSAQVGIILVDAESHTILQTNPKARELIGAAETEITGRICHTCMCPAEKGKCPVTDLGQTLNSSERVLLTKEGVRIPIIKTVVPIQIDNRNVLLESFIDITESKQAEEELHKSEARFSTIIHSLQIGVAIIDAQSHTLLDVNDKALEMIGRGKERVIGRECHRFICPAEAGRCPVTDLGQTVDSSERVLLNSRGQTVPIIKTVIRSTLDGKDVLIESFIDISERKNAEVAIQLANKKLNLLTSITRHDINNQLLALQEYLALMEYQPPDPEMMRYVHNAVTAAKHISSIIAFTHEYESIGVNSPLWHECHALVETAAKRIPAGQITVKNDLPPGDEIFADPLIATVCQNLIDNAVRHGSRKISTLRFFNATHNGTYVIVCEDDGVGIAASEKENIFQRGVGTNTGMGLFLAREILNISGITIRENGEQGKGARFEIAVPEGRYRMAGRQSGHSG